MHLEAWNIGRHAVMEEQMRVVSMQGQQELGIRLKLDLMESELTQSFGLQAFIIGILGVAF